jgi:Big-like domain-containing protein
LTFLAVITPGVATGTVLFFDGSTQISGPVPVNNGSATFTTASLSVGTHSITVRYNGDANFNGSTSAAHKIAVK